MRRCLLLAPLLAAGTGAGAQRLSYGDVLGGQASPAPRLEYVRLIESPATPDSQSGGVRAFYGDRFEWQTSSAGHSYSWDMSGELGGARYRLWLASSGDGTRAGLDYLELQALYSRPLGESGLSLQAGVRRDFLPRPRRSYAALGVQGNLTDPLYVGAFGFVSHRGEASVRLFGLYDLPLTRRLMLQPAFETEAWADDVPELGIGAGPVFLEAGLRLRYVLHEGFAPYVGVQWERLFSRTARI